jgi:threonine dehydrogenase-like Zn-dependent dehydrogenase
MKRAIVASKRQAELIDAAEPHPRENWVVVKVHVAPMCTEYKIFNGEQRREFLGHEAAGEVVAVAQPGRVKVGDRIVAMPLAGCGACTLCTLGDYIHCEQQPDFARTHGSLEGSATMMQYILKQDFLLCPIPEGVSYERASLACCGIGPSFGAFETMGVSAFDTVLITGLGPVGMGAIINARFRGARVIAVESHPWRVEKARQLGADHVIDPRDPEAAKQIKALTAGRGADCALECAGFVAAQRLCIDATRRKGQVSFVGECQDDLAIKVSPDMIRKGLVVRGSWHYNLNHFPRVIKVIQESPLIDQLVSHTFPMSRIQEAFELQLTGQSAKVLLYPWG